MDETTGEEKVVVLNVTFKGKIYPISLPESDTVKKLRDEVQSKTKVPIQLQKLMLKGILKDDDATIGSITKGKSEVKVLLVGSTVKDCLEVIPKDTLRNKVGADVVPEQTLEEKMERQREDHKVPLSKGPPEDSIAPVFGFTSPLPRDPLPGILDKGGNKVRLSVTSLYVQINSLRRSDRIPITSIQRVTSEPIYDFKGYHMLVSGHNDNFIFLYNTDLCTIRR